MKCLDCEGKEFKPAGNQSLHGVMTHLRSKTHQANAARRQEKLGPSDCYFPATMPAIDFNMAQAPLMVFANQRPDVSQTLESLFGAIGRSIQNEVSQKDIRTSLMEGRLQEADKQRKQQQERIDASLAALKKQNADLAGQQALVSKSLTATKVKYEELSQEIGDRVKSFEGQSKEYLENVEASWTSSETECREQLKRMEELLDRNDLRNMKKIDKIAGSVEESQKSFEELDSKLMDEIKDLKDINEGQNVMIDESEKQLNKKTKHLQDLIESQNDQIQALQSQVRESTEEAKYQQTAEAQSNEIHTLKSAMEESSDQLQSSKEIINAHSEKISNLELQLAEKMRLFTKRIEAQDENIYDLESQCQLLRDAREQHEQAMADQMEAHLQQTAKQISSMKQESAEQAWRFDKLEQVNAGQSQNIRSLVSWVKDFQKAYHERQKILDLRETARQKFERNTSGRLQTLENAKQEQQVCIEAFEGFIPSISEDLESFKTFILERSRPTTTRKSATPVNTRASV